MAAILSPTGPPAPSCRNHPLLLRPSKQTGRWHTIEFKGYGKAYNNKSSSWRKHRVISTDQSDRGITACSSLLWKALLQRSFTKLYFSISSRCQLEIWRPFFFLCFILRVTWPLQYVRTIPLLWEQELLNKHDYCMNSSTYSRNTKE